MYNKTIGKIGEDIAIRFLKKKGYKILYRNWRCKLGEVDIVAQEKDFLVFAEIKTRRSLSFGPGFSSVNYTKQHTLIKLGQVFLKRYGLTNRPCRIDVVSINLNENNKPADIKLIKDAFWQNEPSPSCRGWVNGR